MLIINMYVLCIMHKIITNSISTKLEIILDSLNKLEYHESTEYYNTICKIITNIWDNILYNVILIYNKIELWSF